MSQTEALAIFGALMVVLAVLGIVVDWIGKPLRSRKFIPRIYRYADEHMVELDPSRTAFSEAPFMLPSAAPQGVPYVDASGVSDWAQSHFVLPDPESPKETWGALTSANPTQEHPGFAALLHVDTMDTYEQSMALGHTMPMPPPSMDDTIDILPPPPAPELLDGLGSGDDRTGDGGAGDGFEPGMATQDLPPPPVDDELPPPPAEEDDADHWFEQALSEAEAEDESDDDASPIAAQDDALIPAGALDTAPVAAIDADDEMPHVDVIDATAVESEPEVSRESLEEAEDEPELVAAATDASAGPTTESTLFADLVDEAPAEAVRASTFSGLVETGAGSAAVPRPLLTPEQATSEPGVWQPGDPLWTPTGKGTKPSPTLVRRRFWQSASVLIPGIRWYGLENVTRMADGTPPRRRNRRSGKLESMQITGLRSSDDRTISRPYWPGNEPDPFELY